MERVVAGAYLVSVGELGLSKGCRVREQQRTFAPLHVFPTAQPQTRTMTSPWEAALRSR